MFDDIWDIFGFGDQNDDQNGPPDFSQDSDESLVSGHWVDTDGDGIADTIAIDTDHDGADDYFLVDQDGDTVFDQAFPAQDLQDAGQSAAYENEYYTDSNGDGINDTVVTERLLDADGDGAADTLQTDAAVDLDGDGMPDYYSHAEMVDTDQDGSFDHGVLYEDYNANGTFEAVSELADTDGSGQLLIVQYANPMEGGMVEGYTAFDPDDTDMSHVAGDPQSAMSSWHAQETDSSCAVASQEFALEQLTGREFSESELRDLAQENGWFSPGGGTTQADMGNIMEHFGLTVDRGESKTLEDIENCLQNGGQVMVAVDADELWEGQGDDLYGPGMDANHAIQVIGIDRSNPDDVKVIINDSGVENGAGAVVSADLFSEAWQDSNCFMVSAYA